MVARAEGVHVDAGTGTHVTERGKGGGLRAGEIIGRGDLDVAGLAGKGGHREACPFGKRRVVGEIGAAGGGRFAMGLEQQRKGEGLRRLHQPQAGAVERPGDVIAGIDRLDRIGDRQGRDGGAALPCRFDRARGECRAGKWPRRVVDQHDLGRLRGERFEAGTHRNLPRGAAEHGLQRT